MSSAAITTIVTGFAVVTVDNTAQQTFQDDVIVELARGVYPDVLAQVDAAFIATVAEQVQYTIPTATPNFQRTPINVFYDTLSLSLIRKTEAWEYAEEWRDSPGHQVVGYLLDPEDRTVISLVPPPKQAGTAIGGNTPTSVTAWPDKNITVISAKSDTAFGGATYADLQLPIALEVLAREFSRDSDHQDSMYAQVCRNLAQFFFGMFMPVGRPT